MVSVFGLAGYLNCCASVIWNCDNDLNRNGNLTWFIPFTEVSRHLSINFNFFYHRAGHCFSIIHCCATKPHYKFTVLVIFIFSWFAVIEFKIMPVGVRKCFFMCFCLKETSHLFIPCKYIQGLDNLRLFGHKKISFNNSNNNNFIIYIAQKFI